MITIFHVAGIDTAITGRGGTPIRRGSRRTSTAPHPGIRTRTSSRGGPLSLPPPRRTRRLRTGRQRHYAINRLKPRLTTRTLILCLCPLVDAIKAEAVSAPADGGHLGHGGWGIDADGAGEVGRWLLHRGASRARHGNPPDKDLGGGFEVHLTNFLIVQNNGRFLGPTTGRRRRSPSETSRSLRRAYTPRGFLFPRGILFSRRHTSRTPLRRRLLGNSIRGTACRPSRGSWARRWTLIGRSHSNRKGGRCVGLDGAHVAMAEGAGDALGAHGSSRCRLVQVKFSSRGFLKLKIKVVALVKRGKK